MIVATRPSRIRNEATTESSAKYKNSFPWRGPIQGGSILDKAKYLNWPRTRPRVSSFKSADSESLGIVWSDLSVNRDTSLSAVSSLLTSQPASSCSSDSTEGLALASDWKRISPYCNPLGV